jgi:pimeloyl-ACP methyl ester carboxylesterase
MREGTVVEWRAEVGERVEKGTVVLVIESEKSEIEIEAPASGFLRHIYVEPGNTVPCGTVLAALAETADEPFDAAAFEASVSPLQPGTASSAGSAAGEGRREAHDVAAQRRAGMPSSAGPAAGAGLASEQATPVTPAARRRARDLGVEHELGRIAGSGPGGRVTREDVEELARRLAARVEVAPGICLDVPVDGSGPDLVLVPGFGTDISAFAAIAPALAQACRVHALNPRGFGFSDAPALESYDVSAAASDVARVTAGSAMHVVGASLGAAVAIELALAHPGSVRSLVLITPFVEAGGRLLALLDAWCTAAGRTDAEVLARMIVPWMFAPSLLGDPARRERVVRALAGTWTRVDPAVLARWGNGIRAWTGTRTADLARIVAPTLVISGADDVLTPDAASVADAIPGAAHLVLEDCGHAAAIEQAARVAAAIVAHVRANA